MALEPEGLSSRTREPPFVLFCFEKDFRVGLRFERVGTESGKQTVRRPTTSTRVTNDLFGYTNRVPLDFLFLFFNRIYVPVDKLISTFGPVDLSTYILSVPLKIMFTQCIELCTNSEFVSVRIEFQFPSFLLVVVKGS